MIPIAAIKLRIVRIGGEKAILPSSWQLPPTTRSPSGTGIFIFPQATPSQSAVGQFTCTPIFGAVLSTLTYSFLACPSFAHQFAKTCIVVQAGLADFTQIRQREAPEQHQAAHRQLIKPANRISPLHGNPCRTDTGSERYRGGTLLILRVIDDQ